jgi:hypothetical protein
VVVFDDRADRREAWCTPGSLSRRARDPRLRLVASNKDQGRCFIRLDPPSVTSEASLTPSGLDQLLLRVPKRRGRAC